MVNADEIRGQAARKGAEPECGRKVLNFGSLNIDYVYEVDHFVRKGETLSGKSLHKYTGGKGLNQSVALSRAGAAVFHAGCVGPEGKFLTEYLERSGVDVSRVRCLSDVATGHAIIQNDTEGDNCILLFGGANKSITKEQIDETLEYFEEGDYLVLQNEISGLPYLICRGAEKKMTIVLNPSPLDGGILNMPLEDVDYLVLNEVEAAGILEARARIKNADGCCAGKRAGNTRAQSADGEKGEDLLEKLAAAFPETHIVLTLGEKGSMYAWKEERIGQPAFPVRAVDTTAAGDTFTGYFIAGILEGRTVSQAMERAAKASSVAVTRPGAAPSIPAASEL